MPATLEAVQTHLKVKKSPRHNGSDYHEKVRLKTRFEIDRVTRAGVSQAMARPKAPSTQSKSAVNIQYRRFRIFIL